MASRSIPATVPSTPHQWALVNGGRLSSQSYASVEMIVTCVSSQSGCHTTSIRGSAIAAWNMRINPRLDQPRPDEIFTRQVVEGDESPREENDRQRDPPVRPAAFCRSTSPPSAT